MNKELICVVCTLKKGGDNRPDCDKRVSAFKIKDNMDGDNRTKWILCAKDSFCPYQKQYKMIEE